MTDVYAACELRSVSKAFGGREVLREVSLAVAPGEMVAITGPSGAGKSTALNIVGLLDRPDAGEVQLFGASAPAATSRLARNLLRHRLGYMFQNAALVESMTVEANIALAQKYQKATAAQKRTRLADALAAVGLTGFEKRPVYSLSGGEAQRVALGRLIASPRELVLADEPTGSLDAGNRDHVIELLAGLRDRGAAVLIVTHDPTVTVAADRILELAA